MQPGCRSEAKTNYGVVIAVKCLLCGVLCHNHMKNYLQVHLSKFLIMKYRTENCQIVQPGLRRALNAVRRRKQIMVSSTYSSLSHTCALSG